jgi:hypothetical protein
MEASMRRLFPLAVLVFLTTLPFNASAAGVIVDTIKGHVEQHQSRPRQTDQRQAPAPAPNPVEQWVRAVMDALTR